MIWNALLDRDYRGTRFLVLTWWLCWTPVVSLAAADLSIPEVLASPGARSETAQELQGRLPSSATPLPQLPERLAKQVAQDEARLDRMLTQAEPMEVASAQGVIQTAEAVLHIRAQHQGEQWWETIDARQRLMDLRKIMTFTPSQLAEHAQWLELIEQVPMRTQEGNYAEALALAAKMLDIGYRIWGKAHRNFAGTLTNLAILYEAQRAYTEAEPLLQRALAITEQALGRTHPETASSLTNLGLLYGRQGAYTQAEPLLKRALAIREEVFGRTHSETAASLVNLGAVYNDQGAYSQARPLFERELAIREQALGRTHPETASSLTNLGLLYGRQGAYTQAEPLLKRVLAITEQASGPTHPETASSLTNLAGLYVWQGAYTQAEPLLKRALAIREEVFGRTHPETAASLVNLGAVYNDQGAYTQAEPLLTRALAITEQAFGPTHPLTAAILNNLAVVYDAQGAYTQAEPLLTRVLAIREQVLGLTHPDTAQVLGTLGLFRTRAQPDAQAAEWLYRFAQRRWMHLTENFPTLTTRQQQQHFTKHELDDGGYLWHLLTKVPNVDRAIVYQVTLWNKQLLVEATRQESSAVQQVWAKAPAQWQALLRERKSLRRTYASRALHELQNTRTLTQEEARPSFSSTRDFAIHIEDLEQRLRRDYPPYAQAAALQNIMVSQVQQLLQPQQALLEYVLFHPYDESTKHLAKTFHYGVFIVRSSTTPVVAIDLGDAASIYAAIREFHKEIYRAQVYAKTKMTRSQGQARRDEAMLTQASSTLRRLVWQPLEQSLTNVTRVYVAPVGHLSLIPFEALAQQTKHRTWQYLVEERELVYLNTGRDLARLALTAVENPSSTVSARTAVLIGNPKFNARPKEVARVVAGLPTTSPLRATANTVGAGGTLGTTTNQDGLGIPRNWLQYRELDTLLTHAKQQLHGAGWTVTTWRDQQAVEAAVLQLKAPRILQFATHGYLLERENTEETESGETPLLRSMLLLAGVNHTTSDQTVFYPVGKDLLTEAEAEQRQLSPEVRQQTRIDIGDGMLTAYEVTGMDLQGTELVNLTACKTGLGTVTPESVAGLRQAFFFAGARALTTSLWEVPVSEATQQMKDFYARWLGGTEGKSGMTRYAAFRQTQLTALAQARKTYGAGHPFFWAGFIYLGDPGDLPRIALQAN
ncbi:MAG: CHAT domain-containing protein [Nitrospira sp.]|nr:CHAT domain-containing protein [Nitrospira sp.]